ncbi:MAG: alpha/beta hydrolase [Pseudomonadota bacterium]
MRLKFFALLCAFGAFLAGCSEMKQTSESQIAPDMAGEAISTDGLKIAYQSAGFHRVSSPANSRPVVVLVHGWSCNMDFWREQTSALADAGYRAIQLDLAGHGQSESGRETWRVADFGNDVAAVITHLSIDKAVVVGHSMGGLVALQTAAQLPDTVVGVIAVDSLHDAEQRYDPTQSDAMLQPFKDNFPASVGGMFTGMAGSAVAPALRDWIIENGTKGDPQAAIGLLYDYAKLDSKAMFQAAGVPIRAINAAASPTQPPTMIERNQQYADFDATLIDGVGHFLQLEDPARVNAQLIRYLAEFD